MEEEGSLSMTLSAAYIWQIVALARVNNKLTNGCTCASTPAVLSVSQVVIVSSPAPTICSPHHRRPASSMRALILVSARLDACSPYAATGAGTAETGGARLAP